MAVRRGCAPAPPSPRPIGRPPEGRYAGGEKVSPELPRPGETFFPLAALPRPWGRGRPARGGGGEGRRPGLSPARRGGVCSARPQRPKGAGGGSRKAGTWLAPNPPEPRLTPRPGAARGCVWKVSRPPREGRHASLDTRGISSGFLLAKRA